LRKLLKAKIHRATVTGTDLHYEGSISIDRALMEAVDLAEFEAVHVWNVSNGERVETYVMPAEAASGEISLNGAAARLFHKGDQVIIAGFCWLDEESLRTHKPKIVILDAENRIVSER
jgi:aspartate 1-decarboxylase